MEVNDEAMADALLSVKEDFGHEAMVLLYEDMRDNGTLEDYKLVVESMGALFAMVALDDKYKGNNGELWAGRGRSPSWMEAAEAAGKKRDDFLIK